MSNKLQVTKAMLDSAANAKEILELEPVRNNWVSIYNRSTGSDDGEKKYVAEQILFMNALAANKQLQQVDKASIYGAWIELSISGLTLRDGLSYIVPFGKKATFMVGWKGRLEQINEMPNVLYTHEPIVVWDCDDFEYEKGQQGVVIKKHKPVYPRPEDAQILHVYQPIDFQHGTRVYMMNADEVYSIRDRYSKSYQQYLKDYQAAGVEYGKAFTKKMNGPNGQWELTIEPPMWVTDEEQAFKKTLVKRTYNNLPKLQKHKLLDERQMKTSGIDEAEEILDEKKTGGDISSEDLADFEIIEDGDNQQEQNNTQPQQNENDELVNNGDNTSTTTKPVQPAKNAGGKARKNKAPKQQPNNSDNNAADNIPVDEGF